MKTIKYINKQASKELALRYIIGFVLATVSFIVFLTLASQVKGIDSGIYFDQRVITEISNIVTPKTKSFMIFISFLGSAKFYIPVCLVLIYRFFKKKQLLNIVALLSAVLGSALINLIVKSYFRRIRPEEFFQIKQLGFSFPSGHSMVGICAYFMFVYLLLRKKPWDIKTVIVWTFTVIFVMLIGISRIYLGVHWPTDVIGGFALGFVWYYINILIINKFSKSRKLL